MEGSICGRLSLSLQLALQGNEEKKLTGTHCSLFFILTLCTGKNACRFQNMEEHTFFYFPPEDICPLLNNALSQSGEAFTRMILNQMPIIQLVGGRNSNCLYILVAVPYPNFPELSQPAE